ncbi:MAG TPA: type II toxin-antitoxin system VapC family toxin, partial [Phycisphaerae bacterium]|nr:type II toxin-antitoxin system VapC family toxin [Phycisphaerae bacterium]
SCGALKEFHSSLLCHPRPAPFLSPRLPPQPESHHINLDRYKYGHAPREEKAIDDYLAWISIVEFDNDAARAYGRIRAQLQQRGLLVGDMNILIGAIALSNRQSIVTRNPAHFRNMPGLTVLTYG